MNKNNRLSLLSADQAHPSNAPYLPNHLCLPGADLEIEMKILAWLGNQLRPESLFQKDLDIDPFIASTPEAIQAEYEDMQVMNTDIIFSPQSTPAARLSCTHLSYTNDI